MRDFICPNCGQHLAFENSFCLSCNRPLGFSLDDMALLVISSGEDSSQPGYVDADKYELCANLHLAECNWLVEKIARSEGCAPRARSPEPGPTTPTPRRWRPSPTRKRPNGG